MKWKNSYIWYIVAGVILVADFLWLGVANATIANWDTNGIYQQQYQSIEMIRNQLTALFWVGVAGIMCLIKE